MATIFWSPLHGFLCFHFFLDAVAAAILLVSVFPEAPMAFVWVTLSSTYNSKISFSTSRPAALRPNALALRSVSPRAVAATQAATVSSPASCADPTTSGSRVAAGTTPTVPAASQVSLVKGVIRGFQIGWQLNLEWQCE